MSDRTYSEAEIREALMRVEEVTQLTDVEEYVNELIASLNKPKWEPAEGEICAYKSPHHKLWDYGFCANPAQMKGEFRPLNRTELGPIVGELLEWYPKTLNSLKCHSTIYLGADLALAEQAWQDWLDTQEGE